MAAAMNTDAPACGYRDDQGQLVPSALYQRLQEGATMKQVGDEIGLSRERVRQVLMQAGYDTTTGRRNQMMQRRGAAILDKLPTLKPAVREAVLGFLGAGFTVWPVFGTTFFVQRPDGAPPRRVSIHTATTHRRHSGPALYWQSSATGVDTLHLGKVGEGRWIQLPVHYNLQVPVDARRGFWTEWPRIDFGDRATLAHMIEFPLVPYRPDKSSHDKGLTGHGMKPTGSTGSTGGRHDDACPG